MAKIYGLFGSMTGKVGDVVMAVRNGVQVVRKYQPIVQDQKSSAQTEVRAKLKLMSQLGAIFGPVIAIPRAGAVSSRNLFVKRNYDKIEYADGVATIDLASVEVTSSVLALPNVQATRDVSNLGRITVRLAGAPVANVDRVVYIALIKQADEKLRVATSTTVEKTPGGEFETILDTGGTYEVYVYAYGIRDNTETASVKFGELFAPSAEVVAKLITTRVLTENDVTISETKGVVVSLPA